jgi:Na+-transporting methylmalonyl-CoA/oxaloacetate decarboxylase gamma subunit
VTFALDPQALMQGLSISISGMLITFLSLGVFILIMLGLQRIFPPHPEEGEKDDGKNEPEPCEPMDTSEEEIAVAVATAIQYLRSEGKLSLGKSLENGPGPLWTSRRISSATSIIRSNRS